MNDARRRLGRYPADGSDGADERRKEIAPSTRACRKWMAAPGALRRSQPRQARPAEGAYESGFVVRQELITRNADAWEKEIEGPG